MEGNCHGGHVDATSRAPWGSRRMLAAAAVAAGLTVATAAHLLTDDEVSGTAPDTVDSGFAVAGSGVLPTTRPTLGEDRSPLSAEETGYAIHVASTDASIPAGATDVRGEEGPEFLWADLPELGAGLEGRMAVVSLYDYTSGTAYDQVVDLEAGEVVTSTASDVAQPPTSATEADVAMSLAIESTEDLLLKSEFEASTGVPLIATDQVQYVAGAWVFDGTTSKGQECGEDRCAQLMVSTASGVYLTTWDFVVNLSTRTIVATQ
jgi:hypothetical protein